MPTTITTPSNNLVKMRYKEPYVSEGLNRKLIAAVPRGIIRGGRLITAGAGLGVRIDADQDNGDSVYTYVDSVNELSLTFRQAGNITLDLTPFASSTVFIALHVDYSISNATVVTWRAYTEAELFGNTPEPEAGDVIIVGRVDVPASGPIPASDVYVDRARFAFDEEDRGRVAWRPILANGSFDMQSSAVSPSTATGDVPFAGWELTSANAGGDTIQPSTDAHQGDVAAEFDFTSSGNPDLELTADGLFRLQGTANADSLTEARRQFARAEFWVKFAAFDITPGSALFVGMEIDFLDSDLSVLSTFAFSYDLSGASFPLTTANYEKVISTVEAPLGAFYARVRLAVTDTGGTGAAGSVLFDSAQVHLERFSATQPGGQDIQQSVSADSLLLRDQGASGAAWMGDVYQLLAKSGDEVVMEKLKALHGAGATPGTGNDDWILRVFGQLLAARGMLSGTSLTGSAADANRARVQASVPADSGGYTCLFRSADEVSARRFAVFLDQTDSSVWLVMNGDTTAGDVSDLRYVITDEAQALVIGRAGNSNALEILTAPSGTAGNVISWNVDQTDIENPRIYSEIGNAVSGDENFMLLWETFIDVDNYSLRLYASEEPYNLQLGGFVFTVNAVHDNSTGLWSKDTTPAAATAFVIGEDGFRILIKETGVVGTWDIDPPLGDGSPGTGWDRDLLGGAFDSGFNIATLFASNPRFLMAVPGSSDGNNPTATENLTSLNRITAKHIIKAWGQIDVDAGTIQTPNSNDSDGINVTSYVATDAGNTCTVTFDFGFADDNLPAGVGTSGYCVLVTAGPGSPAGTTVRAFTLTSNSFKVEAYDTVGVGQLQFDSDTFNVFWAILGNAVD